MFVCNISGLNVYLLPEVSIMLQCCQACAFFGEQIVNVVKCSRCLISKLTRVNLFQVNKNATLCKSIDEMFEKGIDKVDPSDLKRLMQQVCYMHLEFLETLMYNFHGNSLMFLYGRLLSQMLFSALHNQYGVICSLCWQSKLIGDWLFSSSINSILHGL